MNKRSVKQRPTKAKSSRSPVARKAVARRTSGKIGKVSKVEPKKPIQVPSQVSRQVPSQVSRQVPSQVPSHIAHQAPNGTVAAQIAMPGPRLRAHKFSVGQTVLYTSSPITRPGASGTYKVVKLLPSDGDDYQYRIKNSGEAFERVAKESQLENEH